MTVNTAAGQVAVISLRELRIGTSLRLPIGLSCGLESGQVLVITGPCGSGKSTTLSVIAGRTPSIDGRKTVVPVGLRVIVEGEPVIGLSAAPLRGQYVPQDLLEFWIGAKVFSEVELAYQVHGADEAVAAAYRRGQLAAFCINHKTYDRIAELSAGEQTVVAICSALASTPRLLLLDEPFCFLCECNRCRVIDILSRYLEDGGMLVLATHSPQMVLDAFARFRPQLHMLLGAVRPTVPSNAALAVDCDEAPDFGESAPRDGTSLYELPGTDILTEDDEFLFSTTDLIVYVGDSICVEGANGAGKSTFLRYLGGSTGKWPEDTRLGGNAVGGERPDYPDDVGFVAQVPLLQAFRGTVEAYILFTAQFSKVSKTIIGARFDHIRPLLSVFQINPEELVVNLSSGQRKVIALCRFLNCPRLLLLDELPYFVDTKQRRAMEELLSMFLANGSSLIFTTHHPAGSRNLANRVFRISDGWLRELSPLPPGNAEEVA